MMMMAYDDGTKRSGALIYQMYALIIRVWRFPNEACPLYVVAIVAL